MELLLFVLDQQCIEKIQRRVTKLVRGIKELPYFDKLCSLNLPSLRYQHIRGDLIYTYKSIHNSSTLHHFYLSVILHHQRPLFQNIQTTCYMSTAQPFLSHVESLMTGMASQILQLMIQLTCLNFYVNRCVCVCVRVCMHVCVCVWCNICYCLALCLYMHDVCLVCCCFLYYYNR